MKLNFIPALTLAFGSMIFTGCGSQEPAATEEATTEEVAAESTEEEGMSNDEELRLKLDLIILNNLMVPVSIIEDLKKEEKSLYHENYINSLDNVSKYNDPFSQALNYGVYGMDIMYNAAHDHVTEIAEYKVATMPLATALGLEEVYTDEDMEKFLSVANDHDALMNFIIEEYNKVDHFMMEHNQQNALLLCLTGAMVESMYFTGMAIEEYGMSDLKYSLLLNERNILNQVIPLFDYFEDEKKMALKAELIKIQDDFNTFNSRDDLTDEKAKKLDEDIINLRNKIVNNEF